MNGSYDSPVARSSLVLFVALAALCAAALSPAARTEAETPEFESVTAAVETAMTQAGVPGAVVGVYANGDEEIAAFGVTAMGGTTAVTAGTRFQNGSVTKTYTATAIMRLADEGKIDLSAPVTTYLPEFELADPAVTGTVTVQQLLNHTGGWWGDAYVDTGNDDEAITRFVSDIVPRLPQVAPLGRYVSYNNSAYVVLGRIIEVTTGMPYREAMEHLVFDPLRLTDVTFDPQTVLSGDHAEGHGEGANGIEKVTPLFLPRNIDPAGGIWTTIGDELEWARFHLGDGAAQGRQLLEPESMDRMQRPRTPLPGGGGSALGYPWLISDESGTAILQHDGQTFGQSALLTLVPERDFAIVVLTNSFSGAAVGQAAVSTALREYLDIGVSPGESPATGPEPIQLTPEEAAEYVGRYELPTTAVDIEQAEGGLVATLERLYWPGQIVPSNVRNLPTEFSLPVVFFAEDVAVLGSIEQPAGFLIFLRDDEGGVEWFSYGLRLYPREQ